ncbi:outer membrane beta-barrel protein [Roseibacterium beibuensis]|uniref:outer membrane protein n=1 Tax=[Roseibacterium] beibuensis TaxID=1193142 RepID=UPI00217DA194|nr:outer membrane beta-barrel protein [Roseibacterium beibuensis]MCS6626333.1 outer membrane beta-barrel protein [Roseibacterium beibuensis]
MLKTVSAASLALLLTGVAAPALAQSAPDWSGPYIGVFGGYLQPDEDANETLLFDRDLNGEFGDTVTTSGGADAFGPGFCADQISGGARPCDDDASGVEGGVRLGYDMQFGRWVVGAVGEVAGSDAEDSVTGFSTTPAYYSFTRNLDHTAALRARVGYAAGPALVYATGGVAYGKVENSFNTSNTANSFTVTADEDDADGYQFGGGVEWRLAPSLTLTGEYIYSDLETGEYNVRVGSTGTTPATNPFILAPNTTGTDMIRSSDSFKTHGFRIGMNVRF